MPEVNDQNPWLQADFGAETRVMGISTQGSYFNDFWVTNYSLQYRSNGSRFKQYQQNYRNKVNIKFCYGNFSVVFSWAVKLTIDLLFKLTWLLVLFRHF